MTAVREGEEQPSESLDDYMRGEFRSTPWREQLGEIGKHVLTTAALPWERRVARRLVAEGRHRRLHLGCADNYVPGWCNIDLARPGRKLDLRWDLRRPLPFAADSVEAIFSEHLLEHIPFPAALNLLRQCHRLLRVGGVCRLGVPDLERYILSYTGKDSIIDDVRPGRPTRALAVAELFFLHGHRSMYDFETLSLMLTEAGFRTVGRSGFGRGRIVPCPDRSNRRQETLYMEAEK